MNVLFVGLGGFLGAILRYGTISAIRIVAPSFPLGTLVANITGCLLAGLFLGITQKNDLLGNNWSYFLSIGLLGSYTTFSTFTKESLEMALNGSYFSFFLNISAHLIFCLLATATGFFLCHLTEPVLK